MCDSESIKINLRSVLQSSKFGVSVNRLQSEYRSLCGESIPLRELGYSKLEDYLRSIPSVVRLEHRMGELQCFAVVCQETAHIAELVAKQKSSKKPGRPQVVNCKMRFKPSNPSMLNVRSRSSLRQPSTTSAFNSPTATDPSQLHGDNRGISASGDYRKERSLANCQNPAEKPPEQNRRPDQPQSRPYDVKLMQSRVAQVLEKYCSGLWMSKISEVYSKMFGQKLHPQVLIDLEKWTHICMVEKPSSSGRIDRLIYPPLPPKPTALPRKITTPTKAPAPSPSPQPGPDILPYLKVIYPPTSDSAPGSHSTSSAVVSAEVRQKLRELLSMYRHGLWAHALPKLFMDTYKTPFPEHILDNLSLLLDLCTVEYPIPHDKKKAILYSSSRAEMEAAGSTDSRRCRGHNLPSGLEVLGPVVPPPLVLPSELYPSVLITDAQSSNAVTVRYVGENYSSAQEAMEDSMRSFYSQSFNHRPLSNPVVGQLVAVRGEDEDELARAQVMEVKAPNMVKVYYVDHGFSVETRRSNLLELHQDFLSLPFQATNIRLAGLEAFSSHPQVLSSLDTLAVGKILLMETLEACQQNEKPVAVLHDTSKDEDININSACLKAVQDKKMNNPLTVSVTYQDVCVTNVCADGVIYCQLPSRGTARLSKFLEETEAIFASQMTSKSLVSRPFSGKLCLARYKGKWSRVEIETVYGNSLVEILFIDFGVQAAVEITDLREFPPLLLKDLTIIPPQAVKCCLADLTVPERDWSPMAVLWLKETVLGSEGCRMKILKVDQHKGDLLVYMYLFIGADSQEMNKSINHQLAQSEMWRRHTTHNNNTITSTNSSMESAERFALVSPFLNPIFKTSARPLYRADDSSFPHDAAKTGMQSLPLPPLLELPQPGQYVDVFVPVACHPGYFVLQPWLELHKLVVLMGEMIRYYNQMWMTNTATHVQRGGVYAAKIDKKWHRVQVKEVLANGMVSVYELDYGIHELVCSTVLRPLIEEFRQLPFQAITAQLAGVTQQQWSEEAAMLFRNHVENRALVAQVESVSEVKGELWERRLKVNLVDTAGDQDVWIHRIMASIGGELSSEVWDDPMHAGKSTSQLNL